MKTFVAALVVLALAFTSQQANANHSRDCASYEWECDSGQCIDEDYRCDDYPYDCFDGSDEEDCDDESEETRGCPDGYYECDNGQCSFDPYDDEECDDYKDCNDGSDEDDCFDAAALAIGLSVGGFVLFIVCPVTICLIICCCIICGAHQANRRPTVGGVRTPMTTVVTAGNTSPLSATIVTGSTQPTAPQSALTTYPTGYAGYKQEPPPAYTPGYLPHQPYPAAPYPGRLPEQQGYLTEEAPPPYPALGFQQPPY